jgi:hypothetical protein
MWFVLLALLVLLPAPVSAISYTIERDPPLPLESFLPPATLGLFVPDDFVILSAILRLDLRHQLFADLRTTLQAPSGLTLSLDPLRVDFGDFTPFGLPLAAPIALPQLTGEPSLGLWSVTAQDLALTDFGSFRGFTLELQPVPEPATLMLLASGAAALGVHAYRRRRKH